MPTEKHDRRSQRTRRLLGDALVTLLVEKRYDAITVQDIIDRANVGRTTYYAHFRDKEDLLLNEIGRVVHLLSEDALGAGEPINALLPSLGLFRHVQENRALYQALLWGRGFQHVIKRIQVQLTGLLEQRLEGLVPDETPLSVPVSVLANFVAGAFLSKLEWWMSSKAAYSAEQMDAMFWRLVRPGLESVLGTKL